MYLIQKTINKLYCNGYSFFLNPKDLKEVTSHLKKNTYSIYAPYQDAEKKIIYTYQKPELILLEIIIGIPIRHQDILGTLYSLQIDDSLFGDIIIWKNKYYFYTFKNMQTFFEMEIIKIKNSRVSLIEHQLDDLEFFQRNYKEIIVITSSLRIDSVIAKIIHTNRDNVKNLIKDKNIYYNYELLKDNAKLLKKDDIFSIKKYGKYQFKEIISSTKKDNLIIKILKYIDN